MWNVKGHIIWIILMIKKMTKLCDSFDNLLWFLILYHFNKVKQTFLLPLVSSLTPVKMKMELKCHRCPQYSKDREFGGNCWRITYSFYKVIFNIHQENYTSILKTMWTIQHNLGLLNGISLFNKVKSCPRIHFLKYFEAFNWRRATMVGISVWYSG